MKSTLAFGAIVVCSLATAPPSSAQTDYPSRPVKIVIPLPAGSAPDIRLRLVAGQMTTQAQQQFVVENRPGGGGILGVQAVVASEPDGYTLLAAPASVYTILPLQKTDLSFDIGDALIPLATFMSEPQLVAVSSKIGINTFSDFLQRSKQAPLAIGTNPAGSLPHFAARMIASRASIQLSIVPFSSGGSNDAIREILGGRIQAVVEGRPALAGALASGDIKALAVMSEDRISTLPEVPTASETISGLRAVGWVALCAPKSTPPGAVRKLNDLIRAALAAPEITQRVEQIGTPFRALFGADLAHFIANERALWKPLVGQSGQAN